MCSLQRILDVIPGNIPGMDFMTRLTVSGYQVRYYYCRVSLRLMRVIAVVFAA